MRPRARPASVAAIAASDARSARVASARAALASVGRFGRGLAARVCSAPLGRSSASSRDAASRAAVSSAERRASAVGRCRELLSNRSWRAHAAGVNDRIERDATSRDRTELDAADARSVARDAALHVEAVLAAADGWLQRGIRGRWKRALRAFIGAQFEAEAGREKRLSWLFGALGYFWDLEGDWGRETRTTSAFEQQSWRRRQEPGSCRGVYSEDARSFGAARGTEGTSS